MKNIYILLVSLILVALTSCQGSDNDYKTMVVKNRIASFSFEYRSYYRDKEGPDIVERPDFQYAYVYMLTRAKERTMANPEPGGKGKPVAMSYVPASIHILVDNKFLLHSKYSPTAHERIENSISSWSKWKHFKLMERSKVMVAGIEAELIAYEIDSIFSSWPLEYCVEIAFDHEGLCWEIEATSRDPELHEVVRQDVEHLIATFKILE